MSDVAERPRYWMSEFRWRLLYPISEYAAGLSAPARRLVMKRMLRRRYLGMKANHV